jgi:hypothetical protein
MGARAGCYAEPLSLRSFRYRRQLVSAALEPHHHRRLFEEEM